MISSSSLTYTHAGMWESAVIQPHTVVLAFCVGCSPVSQNWTVRGLKVIHREVEHLVCVGTLLFLLHIFGLFFCLYALVDFLLSI